LHFASLADMVILKSHLFEMLNDKLTAYGYVMLTP